MGRSDEAHEGHGFAAHLLESAADPLCPASGDAMPAESTEPSPELEELERVKGIESS